MRTMVDRGAADETLAGFERVEPQRAAGRQIAGGLGLAAEAFEEESGDRIAWRAAAPALRPVEGEDEHVPLGLDRLDFQGPDFAPDHGAQAPGIGIRAAAG